MANPSTPCVLSGLCNTNAPKESFINLCFVYISMERLYYKLGDKLDEKVLRHLRRYHFAKQSIIDKPGKVIDFGCGSGYGSKLISEIPNTSVWSYDISKEALKFFKENNAASNIFIQENKNELKNADYVLLIDMIEHIEAEELEKELGELIKNNPTAVFFISTPLNDYVGKSSTNPYHINCFTKETFHKFLDKHFKKHELWLVEWNYSRKMNEKEKYGSVMSICLTN